MRSWRAEVWRFGAIGVVGFLIDAGVLTWLITGSGWGLYESRVLSFAVAVTATWYLNRRFTFPSRVSMDRAGEYGRYFVVQTIGAFVNLGVYVAILVAMPSLAPYPVIPLAVGSGVSMIFNFVGARRFAFSGPEPESSG